MKTTILKTTMLAAAVFTAVQMNAQANASEQKKVKVIIKENVNGKEEVFEADELTPEVKQKLKDRGIDPDDFENAGKDDKKIIIRNKIVCDTGSAARSKVFIRMSDNADPELRRMANGGNIQVITRDGEEKIMIDGKELHSAPPVGSENKKFVKVIVRTVDIKDASSEERKKAGITDRKERLAIQEVNCTPNPSNGKFNLQFTGQDKTPADISIRDINGKEVYSESVKDFNGSYSKEIDLNDGAKGIYFVSIHQGNKSITKKMIVE